MHRSINLYSIPAASWGQGFLHTESCPSVWPYSMFLWWCLHSHYNTKKESESSWIDVQPALNTCSSHEYVLYLHVLFEDVCSCCHVHDVKDNKLAEGRQQVPPLVKSLDLIGFVVLIALWIKTKSKCEINSVFSTKQRLNSEYVNCNPKHMTLNFLALIN